MLFPIRQVPLLQLEIAHALDLERVSLGLTKSLKPKIEAVSDYAHLILSKYEFEKIKTIKDRDQLVKQISEYALSLYVEWTDELTENLVEIIEAKEPKRIEPVMAAKTIIGIV